VAESGSNVVKLNEVASGFCSQDNDDLFEWLEGWAKALKEQNDVKSLIIVVETRDGGIYQICQSLGAANDKSRVVGLLDILKHRIIDGGGRHPAFDDK
jgi:hypothetical protein